ncbi:GNAT family N-acetyltransferase [Bacteroidota bacterium]
MFKLRSLQNIDFDLLYESFKEAFVDYEMQLNKDELQRMLTRRGFVPELSFGAFDEDKMVAFTFNGIGEFNGIKTAYDTGTGTIKKYRGEGLATKIFEYSLPFLKEAGVKQYLLEVLQHNTKAVSLYKKLGFNVTREFNYFSQKIENIHLQEKNTNQHYQIKSIELTQINSLGEFHDFNPSWQNSFESIFRNSVDFKAIGAFKENQLVGYCVIEPKSGDITLLAVDKRNRRNGIGSLLFKEALKLNQYESIKFINTEIGCDSLARFLNSILIPLVGKQFEMIKQL